MQRLFVGIRQVLTACLPRADGASQKSRPNIKYTRLGQDGIQLKDKVLGQEPVNGALAAAAGLSVASYAIVSILRVAAEDDLVKPASHAEVAAKSVAGYDTSAMAPPFEFVYVPSSKDASSSESSSPEPDARVASGAARSAPEEPLDPSLTSFERYEAQQSRAPDLTKSDDGEANTPAGRNNPTHGVYGRRWRWRRWGWSVCPGLELRTSAARGKRRRLRQREFVEWHADKSAPLE